MDLLFWEVSGSEEIVNDITEMFRRQVVQITEGNKIIDLVFLCRHVMDRNNNSSSTVTVCVCVDSYAVGNTRGIAKRIGYGHRTVCKIVHIKTVTSFSASIMLSYRSSRAFFGSS